MNKLFVRLLLVLAAFASITIPAKAQAIDQLLVKVPFPFVAAGQTFPAGEYKISRLRDETPRILLLTNLENRADSVALRAETEETSRGKGQLGFTKVGNEHVLSRVQTDDYAYTLAVPRARPGEGGATSSASGSN